MKTKYLLTPMALALATVLSAGAYAEGKGHGGQGGEGGQGGYDNPPSSSGLVAGVILTDGQENDHNLVNNQATENNASITDSLNGASGNVQANVASGDNNQQANAAALASADSAFIFAYANISQDGHDNILRNNSVPNNASVTNSGNGASGNVGINVAAGNYNQQKNDMAIANSSNAKNAIAVSNTSQTSNNNVTQNNGVAETTKLNVSLSLNGGTGSYSGTSEQKGDVYMDSWTGVAHGNDPDVHPGGQATGHIDLDNQVQGAQDYNEDGGALYFTEKGDIALGGTVSGNIVMGAGYSAPVVNNASVTNSLNNASGNVGVNVTSGGGNQQSNSLTMAVGCQVCSRDL